MNPSPSRLPLLALAVAAFAIGTTEFVIMGLLPEVATDLKVSIPSAGMLVSGYALGVAVGAPLLAALTAKMPATCSISAAIAIIDPIMGYPPRSSILRQESLSRAGVCA